MTVEFLLIQRVGDCSSFIPFVVFVFVACPIGTDLVALTHQTKDDQAAKYDDAGHAHSFLQETSRGLCKEDITWCIYRFCM